jgi:hypothetical protein
MKTQFRITPAINMKILSILILTIGILTLGIQGGTAADQEWAPPLFIGVGLELAQDEIVSPEVIRSRYVTINFGLLPDLNVEDSDQTNVGRLLKLNLFADTEYIAVQERGSLVAGSQTWIGNIEGERYGRVILVHKDEQMAGTVQTSEGNYRIRFAGENLHVIEELVMSAFPSEADPIPISPPKEGEIDSHQFVLADDGSQIDVMVVYTEAARIAAGGTSAMENLIALAVTETNDSFTNSAINPRLRLVHTAEVSYTETGNMSTDLSNLRSASDGNMDEVHSWRDTYYADQVSLIVNSGGYCGIGYLMSSVSSSFASYAFTVVRRDCATGYYSYGHEFGHNMGARHDWYVDDAVGSPYDYNKAYVYRPDQWRTIMAYNSECSDAGTYCTRILYWSNPDETYDGDPVGVPPGTSTACVEDDLNHPPCDADNRLTLNNTAYTVANFRSPSSHCGTISSDETWSNTDNVHTVDCDVVVPSGVTLTITEGTIIKFASFRSLIVDGALNAQGTVFNPVYFTSYRDDSIGGDTNGDGASFGAPGDWYRIQFNDTSDDATSQIDSAVIRYGGDSYYDYGAITFDNASPTIQNSTITQNEFSGIYTSTSMPTFGCNDIFNNGGYGLYNTTISTMVIAENQWWGNESGPYHASTNPAGTGDAVTDGVDYTPWLSSPCGTGSYTIFLPIITR